MNIINYSGLVFLVFILTSGCEMKNNPVEVISLNASDSIARSLDTVTFSCKAQDSDGDKLSYEWQSTSGTIIADRDSARWIAPGKSGYYQISCKVVDGVGASDARTITIRVVGGIISGVVTNAVDGSLLEGVSVTIDEKSTMTNDVGEYEFYLSVESGIYDVSSILDLFCPYEGYFEILNDNESSAFTYNFSLSPFPKPGEIRMVLNWGPTPRDMDSHLKTPQIEGEVYHLMYNNRGSTDSAPYATLDVDDTDGYGPETMTIKQPFSGTYVYYIYQYSSTGSLQESGASIQIFNSPTCDGERIQVPKEGSGRYWYVCNIDGDSGDIIVVNQVQNSEPSYE